MSNEKIKPKLNGTAETMLQCFYARAMHSRNPKNKFRDTKAEELIDRIDYDFSNAKKDTAMSGGIVVRSVVFDELVSDFIRKNPDCTVVNIACGLDTRFYRMDNGKITWYNLDLPETIEVRDSIYQESGRVSTIACSVLDPAWADQVKVRGKILFIIEGLTMYMKADEVRTMLAIIRDHFDNAYVCMETLCPYFVKKENIEKSIQATGDIYLGCEQLCRPGQHCRRFPKSKRRQHRPRYGNTESHLQAGDVDADRPQIRRENSGV